MEVGFTYPGWFLTGAVLSEMLGGFQATICQSPSLEEARGVATWEQGGPEAWDSGSCRRHQRLGSVSGDLPLLDARKSYQLPSLLVIQVFNELDTLLGGH